MLGDIPLNLKHTFGRYIGGRHKRMGRKELPRIESQS